MADITKEPWMDPSKNQVAADGRMEGTSVKPVLLVSVTGEPYDAVGGGGGGGTIGGATESKQDDIISAIEDIDAGGSTSSVNTIAASVTSVQLAPADASRIEVIIENDSSDVLYVKYGTAAALGSHTVSLGLGDVLIIDNYKGIVHGAWDAANGGANVTIINP